MHKFERIVTMLDHALDSKRKRHITGGILLSAAMLFGGLAVTIMTIRQEETNEQQYIE